MRKEYDFSKWKGRRNPYAARLKRPVTIRLGSDVVEYLKTMADHMGLPYQQLINMYLRDCALSRRRPEWTVHKSLS